MKIQCNSCEAAEAKVMCCADEAALCLDCDHKVHAANKLAGKHQRVPLIAAPSPSRLPNCDICQEASGYFFCLEDRALFCRNCDVSIHTANSHVSAHRRFLVTGVQVGLEPAEPVTSFTQKNQSSEVPKGCSSVPFSGQASQVYSNQHSQNGYFSTMKASHSAVNVVGSLPDWSVDDLFGFADLTKNSSFTELDSSKADSGKLGSSDGSPPYFPADEGFGFDECVGQVPEISYRVPEIRSPSTASGIQHRQNFHYPSAEHAAFVPDIYNSQNPNVHQGKTKRHRRYIAFDHHLM